MSGEMVVVVTGSNRGIGRAICELILQRQSKVHLIATSRTGADFELKSSQGQSISYQKLDVSSLESIQDFAQKVNKHHPDGIDILINNAGINLYPEHDSKSVKTVLDTNFRSAMRMSTTFLPVIKQRGRIVNLSSSASSLSIYSQEIAEQFRSLKNLEEAESMARKYEKLIAEGREKQEGLGKEGDGYPVSKALVNAITKILASSSEAQDKRVLINCCCPGWVATDMGNIMGSPSKTPAEGARIPFHLAFGSIDYTGQYVANSGVGETGVGQPRMW